MINRDIKGLVDWVDVPAALGLLTRLPLPVDTARAQARGAQAAWAYPLVGLVVGAIAVLAAYGAMALGLDAGIAALLAIAAQIIVTGALHEDGLADSADGLWGGWTAERRLAIMKDSQIGSYGVLALLVTVALRWAAIGAIIVMPQGAGLIIAMAVISRATMPAIMHGLRCARDTGLSQTVGQPPRQAVIIAAGLACVIGLLAAGGMAIALIIAACASSALVALIARQKIGGQTGDILGASQQLSEVAMLLTAVALLAS